MLIPFIFFIGPKQLLKMVFGILLIILVFTPPSYSLNIEVKNEVIETRIGEEIELICSGKDVLIHGWNTSHSAEKPRKK